jgi:PPK2 family polyphosphate:nucleotide phosphotransferase
MPLVNDLIAYPTIGRESDSRRKRGILNQFGLPIERSVKPMSTNFSRELAVKPGHQVKLAKLDPKETLGWKKDGKMKASLEKALKKIDDLQYVLYAERKRSVLVVLQGLDAAGKDGTIRHVMSGINPQGCPVTSFKVPSPEEAAHDFLWRVHKAVPGYGDIGIFNRSHYEDVLVVRVHNLVPKEVWSRRYDEINRFEEILHQNNVKVLKFYLHISREEQKKRLLERIDDPNKRWKISQADFNERLFWDAYQKAYEDALTKCTTAKAPWYIIPADKKWFRNLAISHVIAETMEEMHLKLPEPSIDLKKFKMQ